MLTAQRQRERGERRGEGEGTKSLDVRPKSTREKFFLPTIVRPPCSKHHHLRILRYRHNLVFIKLFNCCQPIHLINQCCITCRKLFSIQPRHRHWPLPPFQTAEDEARPGIGSPPARVTTPISINPFPRLICLQFLSTFSSIDGMASPSPLTFAAQEKER